MRPFLLKADANNQPSGTPVAPDYVENVLLVANADQTVTVPAAAVDGFVLFSADGTFWAKPNGAAAIPVASTTTGAGSVLNPASWSLDGVATIHLIADSAVKLSLSFYARRP
jgi:hypothetical protein